MAENQGSTIIQLTKTTQSVLSWITDKCENGASSEELQVLPEVIKGAAELGKLIYQLVDEGYLRSNS